MHDTAEIARIANLLADVSRARIVWTLIDGTTRPAGELAYAANLSPQSASAHLTKLVHGGLLEAHAQGRHRYFRIASADVAGVIEGIASLSVAAKPRLPRPAALPKSAPAAFLSARTCYGHLAGEMAVRLLSRMLQRRWLVPEGPDFAITPRGEKELTLLGVDLGAVRQRRRLFARNCVDLTQRRAHLGGALGDALLELYVARGWIVRHPRSRVVTITRTGHDNFERRFGI
jgi:DNA-binding transcriptional ArsR family regulator